MKRTDAGARKAYLTVKYFWLKCPYTLDYLLPEPEHKIYLLIDDVLREDTQAVVDLFSPGSSDVWDVAGGDCGEHSTHRVSVPTPPVNIPFFQLKLLKNYQKNVLRWNIISSGVVPDGHLRVLPVSVWRGVILDNLNPVP